MTEKESKSELAEVVEVATQTEPAFKMPDGQVLNMHQFLVDLYNKVTKLEAAMIGK